MIICFRCPPETKQALDRLIKSGQYKDYSEVITLAIDNFAVLQEEILDGGVLIIEESKLARLAVNGSRKNDGRATSIRRNTSTNSKPARAVKQAPSKRDQKKAVEPTTRNSSDIPTAVVPLLFHLRDITRIPTHIPNLPADIWVPGQEVPLDRWLFGQYNKLLPAKANCRALSNLLKEEPGGVPLSRASTIIAEHAVVLGDYLLWHDQEHTAARDDALSTAFPTSKDKENSEGVEKARVRYANQFVASVNSNGRLSGLLLDLKFINYVKRKDPLLQLTEVGWRFAAMTNPVLEDTQKEPTQRFSDEEVALLVEHIKRSVPAEDFAYRAIIKAIMDGANTPETIDKALEVYSPSNHNLSTSFLSSQRSGAISRMADLGLIERVRNGVRVSYSVTPSGVGYLVSNQTLVSTSL
ncbi:MAG TPA: hypothetical protein VGE45_02310 [Chloroflexia bacterium]|jgi:hypothetical protein